MGEPRQPAMSESAMASNLIDELGRRAGEPAWLTGLRRAAWERHAALPWPHASDDVWRRTDATLLDPAQGFAPAQPSSRADVPHAARGVVAPLGDEELLVRVNGAWAARPSGAGGLVVEELTQAAQRQPDPIRQAIEADGLTPAEQKLASLNLAFHQDDLVVRVPPGWSGQRPCRLLRLYTPSAREALYPLTLVFVGAGSSATLIDEAISLDPAGDGAHLINSRIELVLEPGATLHYVRLQRWGAQAREFLLQRAALGRDAHLTMANINLGAQLSKAHVVTRLAGEQASARLYGFVFGHGQQHIDQHTLQDHQAPHTVSDLQFRAALQDRSRMVYTGLIRIAKAAAQTNAYQSNHNLLLSRTAKAETIPMLEILADDVQCKHGASVGPIDEEQAFYLMSRGVPRPAAERLIVMGFIEPIVQQVPFAPLQQRLREELEGGLNQVSGTKSV